MRQINPAGLFVIRKDSMEPLVNDWQTSWVAYSVE